MTRVDLVRIIEGFGCEIMRHGGKHDWYRNPATGVAQPVPRHREIKEPLARRIIRLLSNPTQDEPTPDEPPANESETGEPSS